MSCHIFIISMLILHFLFYFVHFIFNVGFIDQHIFFTAFTDHFRLFMTSLILSHYLHFMQINSVRGVEGINSGITESRCAASFFAFSGENALWKLSNFFVHKNHNKINVSCVKFLFLKRLNAF